MGVADSPLRDRVLFVEGAPRSGTTMLASMLAVHPRIAGIVSESHLFSHGVDRLFENHARQGGRYKPWLASYLDEEQLIDLARDLCDGVLETMRRRVKPEADWVMEKTPTPPNRAVDVLRHKYRCYPDAWYLHIARERDATVRSLLRAPWNPHGQESSERWWHEAVAAVRDVLGSSERYLELGYDELTSDVQAAMKRVFAWLGVEADPAAMDAVEAMSRERISSFDGGPTPPAPAAESSHTGSRTELHRRLGRIGPALRAIRERESRSDQLLHAIHTGSLERVRELTHDDVIVELRSGSGDFRETGEAARRGLIEIGRALFGPGSIGTEWSRVKQRSAAVTLISVMYGDGSRTDASFGCLVRGGKVARVGLISAGDPAGRPPRIWSPSAGESAGRPGVGEALQNPT